MEKSTYLYKVEIQLIAGNGGNGCVSFRRERKVPKGGPDGGDGGRGGSIYAKGVSGTLTLADFKFKRIWRASNGSDGSSQNKTGRGGTDLTISVPIGTQIWCEDQLICDVLDSESLYLIANGGSGGLGNQHFVTSELQAPAISTTGRPGEVKVAQLILKYMADIGVIGLPNAGKSTFVHKTSRANVKIGDYAFTTINPVLGVIPGKNIIIADLPGLIEGAHLNIGLGHQFLQHLDRCRILLHMIDSLSNDPIADFNLIRNEIKIYDPQLLQKVYIVCLTKEDLVETTTIYNIKQEFQKLGFKVFSISEQDQGSIDHLVEQLTNFN